jgi:hypothetical protein
MSDDYEAHYREEQANIARVTEIMRKGIDTLLEAQALAQELNVNFEVYLPSGRKDYAHEETLYEDYTADGTSVSINAWLPSNYNC